MTASSYLYSEVLNDVLRKMPRLGEMMTADAAGIGTTYVTNVMKFLHTTHAPDYWRGQSIYRYGTTTPADKIRTAYDIGVPADGKLYHDGANYTDLTTLPFALTGPDPVRILGWVMEAQRRQYRIENEALVRGDAHDLNMERTDSNYWDGTSGGSSKSGCTVAKGTSDVLYGGRSLTITASSSSWNVFSEKITVDPKRPILMPLMAKTNVGTITAQPYDVTNAALFGTAVTYTGLEWALIMPPSINTPSGCKQVQWKLSGASASDVVVVNTCFGPYDGRLQYNLPSDLDEVYKLQYIRTCAFRTQLATGVYAGHSRVWTGDFSEVGNDYALEIFRADVLNRNLAFDESVREEIESLQWPLFLAGGPQVSDSEPLSDEAAGTTTQPLDQASDYVIWVAMEDLAGNDVRDPEWGASLAEYKQKCAVQTLVRPRQKKQQGFTRSRVGIW